MVSTLSEKQAKILGLIQDEIAQNGRPPTFRDIAKRCGGLAVGTIQDHIKALLNKGFLVQESGVARGFRLAHQRGSLDVPILGVVPAGNPMEAIQESSGSLAVPSKWSGSDLYALKVKGESMRDAGILDGDYVIVKKTTEVRNGEIVVALIEGEATVKYLERSRDGVRLLPANPSFKPIPVPAESARSPQFIQGKVVSVQRFY